MSRTQMQQAQQLIKQGRYDEARRILQKIDSPTAREWLAKLDKRAPARKPRRQSGGAAGRVIGGFLSYLLTIVLSAGLTVGLLAGLIVFTASSRGEASRRAAEATAVAELPTATATQPGRQGVVVPGQNINVRSGPGTNTAAVASLVPGTTVEILGESEDGEWYNVRLSNGSEGWIAASLLDAEPAPTMIAQAETTEPDVTPLPADACPPDIAQTWYDANRTAINKISFTVMQAAYGEDVDYNRLSEMVQENRAAFEAAEAPDCVSELRGLFLVAFQALYNSYQNTVRGFPNEANSEMNIAMQQYERADVLLDALQIVTANNDCGVEVWYAGIADDVTQYLSMIENVSVETGPSQEIRAAVFDLQEIRDRIDVAYPDCAAPANDHLEASVAAAVRLFQAIMAEESVASKQNHLATMVAEATNFLNEMRKLGIRIV